METEVIWIGNIYNDSYGQGYAGNVYDVGGVTPTLKTKNGGNAIPLIIIGSAQKNAYIGDLSISPP